MWVPSVDVGELVLRGVVVYAVLFALLRFIGKKHVGELSPFDLVVLLIVSETVDGSLIGDDKSLTGGLISAATLVVVVQLVGYLTWRFRSVERLVDHGDVCDRAMRSEQVTRAELMEALRREGCSSLVNLRYAVLETDGSITIGVRSKS
jgi:uncharacterized membrane protein YcaP (DUF421 family)